MEIIKIAYEMNKQKMLDVQNSVLEKGLSPVDGKLSNRKAEPKRNSDLSVYLAKWEN